MRLGDLIQADQSDAVRAEKMAGLVLPLDLPMVFVGAEPVTLAELMQGHKAILLDFWASWCGPCLESMPELKERAAQLPAQGIAVAAVNTDQEHALELATKIRSEKGMSSVTWLLDAASAPYAKALMIDSIPRAVLVSATGTILYSGHPSDLKLDRALAAVLAE